MIFDAGIIAALVALAGTFIAAALSSAGYLYRASNDQKRSARRALYHLLELRYAIGNDQLDAAKNADAYFEYAKKRIAARFPMVKLGDVPAALRDLFAEQFKNMIAVRGTDITNRLLGPYEESLLELSTVNPVLAFRLRGREKVSALFKQLDQYTSRCETMFSEQIPEKFQSTYMSTASAVRDDAVKQALTALDKDVLLLAQECGQRDYKACQDVLKHAMPDGPLLDFSDLDQFIDQITDQIIAAQYQSTPGKRTTTSV